MAEQAETPKILDEISKSNTAKSGGRTSRQQQNARRRFAVVIVLFLPILAGLLFLGYQQRLLQVQLSGLNDENQRLTLELATQNTQLQQLDQQLAEPQEPIPVDNSAVREVRTSLNAEIQRLGQQLAELENQQVTATAAPSFEWKILEAEYLLSIANQKLQLEADLESAIVLVTNADAALVKSGSNNVFAVRQAISNELAQLRNVEVVDREGIYLRVGNLANEVDGIDLLSSMQENFESRRSAESAPVEIGSSSNGFVDSALSFLSSVFVWRKWDESPAAVLAPGQDTYIKQNLRLMLEQAQLALLTRDSELFRRSLSDSEAWLHSYAVTDSATGQSIIAELNQLSAIDIDPPLPAINQSLTLIQQLTASDR